MITKPLSLAMAVNVSVAMNSIQHLIKVFLTLFLCFLIEFENLDYLYLELHRTHGENLCRVKHVKSRLVEVYH